MKGIVYLVGAGPGDPDLITRKGLRCLQQADVVIYDRLIPHQLLDEVRADARLVNAGKAPTKHRLSQAEINQAIVHHALEGRTVVRLKGGDPFVFGRGGEEALVCRACGIPFEIVPGISSSFAVPAYAGIPLTHREVSRSFTVITGHTVEEIDFAALVAVGGTLAVLMGVRHLPRIVAGLLAAGLDPQTLAAAIEWGATPAQRVISGAIVDLPELARAAVLQSPAVIIIGETVALRDGGLAWYEERLVAAIQGEAAAR